MGIVRIYKPVKIIAAITFRKSFDVNAVLKKLENFLSPVDSNSRLYQFAFTQYYEKEMGENLQKQMVSFRKLCPAENLPDIKLATNLLEDSYKIEKSRTVNIDPGYLCEAKLVLATTKDYDHRLYLNRGIFGDVHLKFQDKSFKPNPWTYPDYLQAEILTYFQSVRDIYLNQLKELNL